MLWALISLVLEIVMLQVCSPVFLCMYAAVYLHVLLCAGVALGRWGGQQLDDVAVTLLR